MANKKISELAVRTPSLSDLMLVGDPSTGYSYKATISSLSTLLEANIALDDLNDVTITSPTAGQVLSYNGTSWVNDTNGITGTGTINYVPKFTSSSAIGNSIIYDDGASPYQRVGIATTSLDSRFLVKGIDNTSANTTIKAIDNSDNALFYVRNDGNLFVKSNLGLNTASPDLFSRGYAGPILGMTTSSGNVGIEMNSASGSSSFIDMGNGGGRTFSIAANPTSTVFQGVGAFPMIFQTNSSEVMRLNSSGNLGLGTSSPQTQLDIANGLMFGTIDAFPSATYDAAAVIAKTGSLGSAPFNNAGSIVYRARVTSTAGRSSHIFYTGSPSTERMRLDESGNLGLGVTPSAWGATWRALELEYSSAGTAIASLYPAIMANTYNTGGGFFYKVTGQASYYQQIIGQHRWHTAPSGTAGNAITFTQAMTLDASGNLLVATTSPSYNAAGRGNITIGGSSTSLLAFQTGGVAKGYVFHSGLYMSLWNEANGYIEFGTNNAERMRITSGGNVLIGSTTDGGQKLQVTGQAIISSTSSRQLVVSYPGGAEMRLTASATANNFSILDVNGYGLTHGTSWSGINASQSNIRLWTQATNTTTLSLGGQDINPTVARTRTIIEPLTSSTTLFSPTSGNAIDYVFRTAGNSRFSPTSGNATYTFMSIAPEYNTTGTYSGTVTGFIYNPTLTSLTGATHTAIQTVSGDVLFGTTSGSVGVGTSTINASAILQVDSTTKGFLPPRMTNAQMVAIATPAAGLVVYDTTNNKLNVYDGTNWVTLH